MNVELTLIINNLTDVFTIYERENDRPVIDHILSVIALFLDGCIIPSNALDNTRANTTEALRAIALTITKNMHNIANVVNTTGEFVIYVKTDIHLEVQFRRNRLRNKLICNIFRSRSFLGHLINTNFLITSKTLAFEICCLRTKDKKLNLRIKVFSLLTRSCCCRMTNNFKLGIVN
ncbi:unnamed protein product [Brugia timori]|uniref:Uncharacterized protein n=1 Tax=Brugia timori TaxID=42155 RepID=A0A0R3QSE4_9BILA|nr:unnamed protein product [Brugia timori]